MSESLSREIFLRGSPAPVAPWIPVAFGPLAGFFDPGAAGLRDIRLGGKEVVRGIYAAVRDRNWGTIEPELSDFRITKGPGSFDLSFTATCRGGEIDYVWQGAISGNAAGELIFTFDGLARSEFWRNRIGFCVLHPPDCQGLACELESSTGRVKPDRFPRLVEPWQPFRNLRAIRWSPRSDATLEVRFDGDIFETEDQRNWTDASFKTYCTPLEKPFPALVKSGDRVAQAVHLRLLNRVGPPPPSSRGRPSPLAFQAGEERPLLRLGLACASHGELLTEREKQLLGRLRLDHVRVELRLAEEGWPEALRQAAVEASEMGATLHAAIFVSDQAEVELAALADAARTLPARVSLWLIYHASEEATTARWVELARQYLEPVDAQAEFAAGANGFFTQINRSRPSDLLPAMPCYSINPQVHAFDDRTLVENLAAQPSTVETAWNFAKEAVISPITLRMRSNPAATGPESASAPGELPAQVDPRQLSLFCAVWTLGSIAQLAACEHLFSATYFETTGWLGLMEREQGCALPERFPSFPGGVFPVYQVFAALAGYEKAIATWDADELYCVALELRKSVGGRRWLVANLRLEPQTVRLRLGVASVRMRVLDEKNAEEMMREPERFAAVEGTLCETAAGLLEFTLLPYAFAQIDEAVNVSPAGG